MAYVNKIERLAATGSGRHPTEVTCRWTVVSDRGRKLLQLNTYGSRDRQMPEKLSQTLQFDEAGAKELKHMIESVYPNL